MDSYKKAILFTLSYADIFDYPLTKKELFELCIAEKPLDQEKFYNEVENLRRKRKIAKKKLWYSLQNRSKITHIRAIRLKESLKKEKKARFICDILRFIPTIKLIGISGSLSMRNATKYDDIDFIIISQSGWLWFTRLCILVTLQIIGVRRKKTDTKAPNKICVNLIIDEKSLAFGQNEHDVFTAHEIIQMKPILSRNNSYQQFIFSNLWIQKFLPHSIDVKNMSYNTKRNKNKSKDKNVIEYLAKVIQLWYMEKKTGMESSKLAFYDSTFKKNILSKYYKKIKRYEV